MEYPRPQLRRANWKSLDGTWAFHFDDACRYSKPSDVPFDREIRVPYAPEAPLSGIGDESFHTCVWYRRSVALSPRRDDERVIVHFGAVDYQARIFVDDQFVGEHQGGHVPFHIDVSDFVRGDSFELALVAKDDPADMHKPRGKQDWQREPHSIWYPRTTGIWRTVWLECLSPSHIVSLEWRPDVPKWQIALRLKVAGFLPGQRVSTTLKIGSRVVVADDCALHGDTLERVFVLPDGGIDDVRDQWMWSPEHPQLIDAQVVLLERAGEQLDEVQSYTALRTVSVDGARFMLNSRPYALRMVLDQGYWPDGLMTASPEKLRADVELIKRLGFNGARKHQKIEDPRWLYWCDVLGVAVWGELPSAYAFSGDTVTRLHEEWRAALERDLSHPCIVAWVPVNESWGVPELPNDARQRALVRSLVDLTHAIDGTRPVVGNDGWEIASGDLVNIHDYHNDPEVIFERYGTTDAMETTLKHSRPARRRLLLEEFDRGDKPVMLTEFGGIAFISDGHGWGYSVASNPDELASKYAALLDAVHRCLPLAGFCYTQLTDTFLEKNGLLTEDRLPKADIDRIAAATRGDRDLPFRLSKPNPLGYNDRWLKTLGKQLE